MAEPGLPPRTSFTTTLVLAMGAGPLVIYGLSALSPLLIDDLSLDPAQFGVLATLSFLMAAPLSLVAGRLTDVVGARAALLSLFTLAASALALVAVAGGFLWLAAAAVLSAWPQAVSNPVTNRLVAMHVVGANRGAVIGIKQSGVQVSQVFAGLVLPTMALLVGWRGAVAALAVTMLVGGALSVRVVPARERVHLVAPAATPARVPGRVWLLAVYIALMGACLQATNVYAPLAAHERLGFSPFAAGLLVAVIGAAGLVARIWWGRVADRIGRPIFVLTLLASLSAVGSALFMAGMAWSRPEAVWVAALVHGSAALPVTVVVVVTMMRWTPVDRVGRASGILAVGLFTGFAAGPATFGGLYAVTGSYQSAWSVVSAGFVLAAALVQLLRVRGRSERPASR